MTPEQYYDSQAFFNKNLREMSESDRAHIINMISEYAIMRVEQCRDFVKGTMRELILESSDPINFTDGLE